MWQHHRRDHLVVVSKLAFVDVVGGKEDFLGVGDHDLSADYTDYTDSLRRVSELIW